jgi:Mg2+/Co2+ transporter CorB
MVVTLAVEVFGVTISDTAFAAIGVGVILVLVALSAFFSSSEIAMFSLAAHRVDALSEEGKAGRTLAALRDDPHRLLVTILVGNNLVNIAMSAIATGLLTVYLGTGPLPVIISTIGITSLVLLFGESAPKSYAIENTESWALAIARPLKLAEKVLLPLVALFDYLTRIVNRVTGGR